MLSSSHSRGAYTLGRSRGCLVQSAARVEMGSCFHALTAAAILLVEMNVMSPKHLAKSFGVEKKSLLCSIPGQYKTTQNIAQVLM